MMYKLFKEELLEDQYHDLQYCWVQIGENYSKLELKNLKYRLAEGKYILAKCEEFSILPKTFKNLCNEHPLP